MRQKRKTAFTLVELLVVIGIIAILIAVLLPVLGSARRQAAQAKCATQMRELGNAMVIYSQDHKGHLPPVRLGPNSVKYDIEGITYHRNGSEVVGKVVKENAKWWHFLGKYISKKKPMAQTDQESGAIKESIFWCPSFDGFPDAGIPENLVGGINRNATGIGMNNYPTFKAGYPDPSTAADFPPVQAGKPSEEFVDCLPTTAVASRGTWYKLSQFTQPAQRALLADARQFYLEAKRVTSSGAIPGQRLNFITKDYSPALTGQTTFDFYRHGQFPRIDNGSQTDGYFRATGGKIAYNILFADNHVESPPDRESGYRACRMRFPG